MSTQSAAKFSSAGIAVAHSHNRQTSVASFASSLYLPVDPDSRPSLDDETDAYPSSDELFGPDHEEGDDYTISSRRYLSSHSRYSSAFSQMSHPLTPPRSTRSTISLERSPSLSSLTPPPPRHSNTEPSSSPSAWTNRPVLRTMTSTSELPSPPSTARSSNDAHMSSSLDQFIASQPDQGVPIEKFDQLAQEHLEQDKALLQMLRKLDDQKLRIAQLTYALSRLRILSNSACLVPGDSDAPVVARSSLVIQPRRLGAVIPKPLIVQQSSKSASSTIGRSAIFSTGGNTSGLSGPSQNEAVNQRRRAKQQLHEFALRRPTRTAKGRPSTKPTPEEAVARGRRGGWEGARGSPSLVVRETKSRAAGVIGHPNITVRRPKRPDPTPQLAARTPRPSAPAPSTLTATIPNTPPRLLSLFSSPSTVTSRSPRASTQLQISTPGLYDPPTTPVPSRKNKDKSLPPRPVSPTKPMRLARNLSIAYDVPPVPPLESTTAHVTLIDRSETTPPLPVEEVQNRLAATFAHFSRSHAPSSQPRSQTPSPPRRALDFPGSAHDEQQPPIGLSNQPDYLEQMLQRKWIAQLDEHSHQARGSWRSPLKTIKQKITGGLGIGVVRRPSRASLGDSSSEAHSHTHTSLDVVPGYVHGLGTVQEGSMDLEMVDPMESPSAVDPKARKLKKKGGGKEESSGGVLTKSSWRFSRLGSSAS